MLDTLGMDIIIWCHYCCNVMTSVAHTTCKGIMWRLAALWSDVFMSGPQFRFYHQRATCRWFPAIPLMDSWWRQHVKKLQQTQWRRRLQHRWTGFEIFRFADVLSAWKCTYQTMDRPQRYTKCICGEIHSLCLHKTPPGNIHLFCYFSWFWILLQPCNKNVISPAGSIKLQHLHLQDSMCILLGFELFTRH